MPRTLILAAIAVLGLSAAAENKAPALDRPEKISWLDNGTIKIGINLDLGGAITYLSPSKSDLNMINSHDWGRQIQMSHYSGPIPFEPAGKKPHKEWAGLGWNPIQSGDCGGYRSKVVEHTNDGKAIHVKCIPMQWPLENEPGECTFECWIELKDNTAEIRGRLLNARSDKTQYRGRGQELPAIYTNGPWWRLMTYTGDKPFESDALVQQPAKMPWSNWQATENWSALVDDNDFGLGVYTRATCRHDGGFAGKPGKGGPKDNPTGYIAPVQNEIIDHNIDYTYGYTLIVGKLDQIRRYVYDRAPRPGPPVWKFEADRQHWHYANASDAGWPIKGELRILLDQKHPMLVSPLAFWKAQDAPTLYIEAACNVADKGARVFWGRHDSLKLSSDKSVPFDLISDDRFHTYEINLAGSKEYNGVITSLRIDPGMGGTAGDSMRIRSIGLRR